MAGPRMDRASLSRIPKEMRRDIFVAEFIKDFDPERAGRAIGYREGYSARGAATAMLRDPVVQQAIAARVDEVAKRHEISLGNVLEELARVAFANMGDYTRPGADGSREVALDDLTRDQLAAVSEVTTEIYVEGKGDFAREVKRTRFRLHPKQPALEALYKHLTGEKFGSPTFINNNLTVINQTVQTLVTGGVTAEAAMDSYRKLIG